MPTAPPARIEASALGITVPTVLALGLAAGRVLYLHTVLGAVRVVSTRARTKGNGRFAAAANGGPAPPDRRWEKEKPLGADELREREREG